MEQMGRGDTHRMSIPGLCFGNGVARPLGQPLQVVQPFVQVLAGAAGHSDPLRHGPYGRG